MQRIEFSPLITQHLKGQWFQLVTPMEFTMHGGNIGALPKGVIPSRYKTDLASIPNLVRGLLDKDTEHAAVLHDYLLKYGYYWSEHGSKIVINRRDADKLFYIGLRSEGEDHSKKAWLTANAMYYAVRMNSVVRTGSFG